MDQHSSFSDVTKNDGFKFLWLNQIFVQLAYNTLNFALLIWVFKLTHTNLAVSALMLCIYLPSLLFGIFAGTFVDKVDRRKLILYIDLLLSLAFISFIFIRGSLPLLLLNTFIINSLAQFFMPSESSSIPMLVSKKQLFLANSMFSLTLYGTLMLGFTIGGPILNTFGINAVFMMGSFLLIIAFVLAQNLPVIKVDTSQQSFMKQNFNTICKISSNEAKETFKFIKSKLNIAVAIGLMAVVQGVIGMMAVMMPSYMERVLLIHATDVSYFVMLPLGLGMVTGAYLIGKWFHNIPRRNIVIPAVIGAGVLLVLIGIAPSIARLLSSVDLPSQIRHPRYFFKAPSLSTFFGILAYLLGFATVAIIIPCQTVLQENTPEEVRGKIFAVLGVLMTAFSALPVILAGGISDLIGVTPIFITIGIGVVMIGIGVKHPHLIFEQDHLSFKVRQFLGLGHWEKEHAIETRR